MNLKALEYANFALHALAQDKSVESFVFDNALNGIWEFLRSARLNNVVILKLDIFEAVINTLKIYKDGGSCLKGILEQNLRDFEGVIKNLQEST